ncbi:hypothetical protein ACFUMH_03050 [Cellulomonas sp. NPDC057328]|uniref:hypothetical protein n=1 Tax=Cellulomonas sp. NPDC057328 TaxID=3346101 RepID=UPI003645A647
MLPLAYDYSYESSSSDDLTGAGAVALVVFGLFYVAMIVFGIYLYMRVARKAGWTLWHGLLVLVPLANIVFLIMFAFMEWPVERRLREAEARLGIAPGTDPYGQGYGGYAAPGYGGYVAPGYGGYAAPGHDASGGYGTGTVYGSADPYAPPASPPLPTAPATPPGTASPYGAPADAAPAPGTPAPAPGTPGPAFGTPGYGTGGFGTPGYGTGGFGTPGYDPTPDEPPAAYGAAPPAPGTDAPAASPWDPPAPR